MSAVKNFATIHLLLLDRCVGSCNTLKDLSNKVCIPNKTEDLNLSVFNMTAGIFESKTLTKHLSYECKCRFDGKNVTEINVGITINANMGIKNIYPTKNYVWNPATCNCENGKYLASIMDDSAIICDEVIMSYEGETNVNETKHSVKQKIFMFYLPFY